MQEPDAIYVYCVLERERVHEDAEIALDGLEDRPVSLTTLGRWVAVTGLVSLDDWVGSQASERLEDIRFVAPRALRHQQIVDAAAALAPVFPMRFGTIFASAASLSERLDELTARLDDFFARTADADEWSIKGWLDEGVLSDALSEGDDAEEDTSGLAYLMRKRRDRDMRESMDRWIVDRAAELRVELDALARASLALPTKNETREADERSLVLKWVALVPRDALDALDALLDGVFDDLQRHGLELELVGPWPPYSFREP